MKDKLFNVIARYFPMEYFNINERHEKVGAIFYEVIDKDTEGKNLRASFFILENEPDVISIEINNVMNKANINDAGDTIIKVLNNAIELREQYLKIQEHQKKLIELEKKRTEEK